MDYESAEKKSRYVFQYKCRSCKNAWWGGYRNDTCRDCTRHVKKLPFSQTIGIGWFTFDSCNRKFAGFCRGDVMSECHVCKTELSADSIVPHSFLELGKVYRLLV
mmetsp:Transcript_15780/g.21808  ORF Transcript_15780/g.21808 Transcript_15780/m.21808 type:complete len:105 (-) Transcript_15780:77-391(-)